MGYAAASENDICAAHCLNAASLALIAVLFISAQGLVSGAANLARVFIE